MLPRKVCIAVLIFVLVGACRLGAEEPSLSVALTPGGAPALQGVVYQFFDDQSGTCTARLRIARVEMEYRRQGFMRVAWRPLVVLRQVEFEFKGDMTWSAQGRQVGHDLLALGGREELVMREVRVHLAGTPRYEIAAPTARILPGAVLEFSEAALAEGDAEARPAGTLRLPLTGPNAGRLLRGISPAGRPGPEKISPAKIPTQFDQ